MNDIQMKNVQKALELLNSVLDSGNLDRNEMNNLIDATTKILIAQGEMD